MKKLLLLTFPLLIILFLLLAFSGYIPHLPPWIENNGNSLLLIVFPTCVVWGLLFSTVLRRRTWFMLYFVLGGIPTITYLLTVTYPIMDKIPPLHW